MKVLFIGSRVSNSPLEYSGAVGKRRRILEEKEYGTESPREEENIETREVEAEEGEEIT